MKAQVIVTYLPTGSKIKSSVEKNQTQLLQANSDNKTETKWWNHYLAPLEEKYSLVYHVGKNTFQIYYPQGKNNAVNKEINQIVSNQVRKADTRWQEILKVTKTFETYRQEKLNESLVPVRQQLTELIVQQQKLDQNSAEFKALADQQQQVLENYKNSAIVQEVNAQYVAYQKDLNQKIDTFLKDETDFEAFVKTLEFINPETEVK